MTSLTQHSAAPVRMERLALPATDGYPLSAYRYHAPGHAHGNLLVAGATGVAQRLPAFRRTRRAPGLRRTHPGLSRHRRIRAGKPEGLRHVLPGLGLPGPRRRRRAARPGGAAAVLDRPLLRRPRHRPAARPWAARRLPASAAAPAGAAGCRAAKRSRCACCGPWCCRRWWPGKATWPGACWAWATTCRWGLPRLEALVPPSPLLFRRPGDAPPPPALRRSAHALSVRHRPGRSLAPPRSRDAFVEAYRNAPLETLDLRPDGGPLGHMGYFRAGAEALWDDALRWLRRHPENA